MLRAANERNRSRGGRGRGGHRGGGRGRGGHRGGGRGRGGHRGGWRGSLRGGHGGHQNQAALSGPPSGVSFYRQT